MLLVLCRNGMLGLLLHRLNKMLHVLERINLKKNECSISQHIAMYSEHGKDD